MAGLSTARAAVELGLSAIVVEKGTVCGQGATRGAAQGHVWKPDSEHNASSLSNAFRENTHRILEGMTARGYDLGLRKAGTATMLTGGGGWGSWIAARFETWILWWYYVDVEQGDPALFNARDLAAHNMRGPAGAVFDYDSGTAEPCKVLDAWRSVVTSSGRGEVLEGAEMSTVGLEGDNATYSATVRLATGEERVVRRAASRHAERRLRVLELP